MQRASSISCTTILSTVRIGTFAFTGRQGQSWFTITALHSSKCINSSGGIRRICTDSVIHSSALRDFKVKEGETRRHMLRITPQAERPFFDPTAEVVESSAANAKDEPETQKTSNLLA
jgi:hypothetical protein